MQTVIKFHLINKNQLTVLIKNMNYELITVLGLCLLLTFFILKVNLICHHVTLLIKPKHNLNFSSNTPHINQK